MKKTNKDVMILNFPIVLIINFGIFLTIISLAPLIGNQFITGTIVNAVFFISTFIFGISVGLFLVIIPSLIAALSGILPIIIFPMIPFIIISNIILITCFNYFKNKYWLGVIVSSFLKFSFLFLSGYFVLNLILSKNINHLIITMMGWHQLITAMSGGIVAYLYLKIMKKI